MSALAEHLAFLRKIATERDKACPDFQLAAWNMVNGHLRELEGLVALAADVEQAPGEAPQSGHEVATPSPSHIPLMNKDTNRADR